MPPENNTSRVTVVFVHGWAMNSAVWEHCIGLLPDWIDVVRVDLPGHGSMSEVTASGLNDYVTRVAAVVNKPVIWVGWSLGGLVVIELAKHYPERVAGLFLVATNPSFVRQSDWPVAIEKKVFDQFAQALQEDVDATVRRFLALQVKGTKAALSTVRELQQSYQSRGVATEQALETGLDILSTTDLRSDLKRLTCPLACVLGGRDQLVPVAVAESLKKLQPAINITIEPDAGHAPFISHPQNFIDEMVKFANLLRTDK